jgi:CRP/FNR family transcriptional regulator
MDNSLILSLNPDQQEFFNTRLEKKEYKKDEVIFSPLDKCTSLNIIIRGRIKLCKYASDGKEQIVSILDTNNIFGEALVFEELNYPVYVIADKDCTVGLIKKDVLLELIQCNKQFTLEILEELTKKIRILNEKLEYLSYSSIKQRLARFLMDLSLLQNSNIVKNMPSKQKVANILGTSREVVSRNYSALKDEGYLKEENRAIILDLKRLKQLL